MYLTAADYAVTVSMLVIPTGIGIFYAWKDSKSLSKDEYLLGGRKMNIVPVTLSIFVTFQSAISLLGVPGDIYLFGPMVCALSVGNTLSSIFASFAVIPLVHPLQMTSIYEYLEMRYESRKVRVFTTVVGMLQTFFYMVIVLLAPGLALQAAAGIPFWISVAVVGSIGTLYTAIGGIKGVIWGDAFQALVLFTGVNSGGWWRGQSVAGGSRWRQDLHTWWGMTLGVSFSWLTCVFAQSNLQRISAMQTMKSAQLASLMNVPCQFVYGLLLGAIGIIGYAYFCVTECDPLQGGLISNLNQISLYFTLHVLKDSPGLAGFFMATLFSSALSTLSSGINALAANTVEDIMACCLRDVSERKVIACAKVMVFIYGFSIIGVAYLAESLQGPVTQMTGSIFGACGSVVIGLFLTGCTVPWANKYGAILGGILTLALNLWIVIGGLLHGKRTKPLPLPPTDQCPSLLHDDSLRNSTFLISEAATSVTPNTTVAPIPKGKNPYEYGFFLYDISYEWYTLIGTLVCSAIILIISKLTQGIINTKTNGRLIFPSLRKFWNLEVIPTTDENELDPIHM